MLVSFYIQHLHKTLRFQHLQKWRKVTSYARENRNSKVIRYDLRNRNGICKKKTTKSGIIVGDCMN